MAAPSTAATPEEEKTDYNEVAAALESIYKLSPAVVEEKSDDADDGEEGKAAKRKRKGKAGRKTTTTVVVRSRRRRRGLRLDLGKSVEMQRRDGEVAAGRGKGKAGEEEERELEETLLREHAVSTDMGSLDWKRMEILPVLISAQSIEW